MAKNDSNSGGRQLDPIERSSEVLFGLIMVLTFTGSLRISGVDNDSVNRMLVAALGCNLAWGIIDAVMYLMGILTERSHNLLLLRQVRTVSPEAGRRLISDAMSTDLAKVVTDTEVEAIRQRFVRLPEPAQPARLHFYDYRAALGVFLLVFLSTFPVVLPFLLIRQPGLALRVSNLVAIILLFLTGYAYGKYAGRRPLLVSFWMVVIGLGMGGLTIALGG
jgi:VIT1/CCC1 family predicted Fe2+/Mn2+ transporter